MAWWDLYPTSDYHSLDVRFWINKFKEIENEWRELYTTLTEWKEATTEELENWKNNVIDDLNERERVLRAELENWKDATETDISGWKDETLENLNQWKTATTVIFENIRVQAENAITTATNSATLAQTSAQNALISENNARTYSENIQNSSEQIAKNKENIENSLNTLYNREINGRWEQGGINNNTGGNLPTTYDNDYIRTGYIVNESGYKITVDENYLARIFAYNEPFGTEGFIKTLDNAEWNGERIFPYTPGYQLRIRLKNADSSPIDKSVGETAVNIIKYGENDKIREQFINELNKLYSEVISGNWQQGGINNNTGGNSASSVDNIYIRSGYITNGNGFKIKVLTGYEARVYAYNENYGVAGFIKILRFDIGPWNGEEYFIFPEGYQIRIRINKSDMSDIIYTDGDNIVTITKYSTDTTLTKLYAPADGKITGDEIRKRLNIVEGIAINAGDDLNDYIIPGRYFSRNTTITNSLKNCPITDTGFVLDVSKVSTNSEYYQQTMRVNNTLTNEYYHRICAPTFSKWYRTADIEDFDYTKTNLENTDILNPLPVYKSGNKKTITVMTNNVRLYLRYDNIAGLYNLPEYVINYRNLLMHYNIDLLFIQESQDFIDSNKQVNTFSYLFKYFFIADHNIDTDTDNIYTSPARRKIYTKLPFDSPSTELTSVVMPWTLHENWNGYYSYCITNLENIGRFLLINIHNYAHSDAEQIINRKLLLDNVESLIDNNINNFDYFIIAGDFNTISHTDRDNLLAFCNNINGVPCNGGMLGWFNTSAGSNRITSYCFDNIIVSDNIRIDEITCMPKWAYSLFSDHLPVIAKLTLL